MIEYIIHGLLIGSLYAVLSVGLTLLFGIMKVINSAHGEIYLIGGYIAYAALAVVNPYLALPVSLFVGFLTGLAMVKLMYFPVERLKIPEADKHMIFIVSTFGLSIFLQNVILLIWGPMPVRAQPFLTETISFAGISIYQQRLFILVVTVCVMIALFLILFKTKAGLALRALSQDVETAKSMGVKVAKFYTLNCGLATMLAALGGAIASPIFFLAPAAGIKVTFKAFAIVVLGGMGSVWGALLGSLILGVAESLSVLLLGEQWALVIFFVSMIVTLLIRPTGIFGEERLV